MWEFDPCGILLKAKVKWEWRMPISNLNKRGDRTKGYEAKREYTLFSLVLF